MDADEYQSHVNSIIADRSEKYQNLNEEFYDYWASINNGTYEFDYAENDIHHLRLITKTDLLEFYDQFISPFSSTSSSLSIHLESQIVPDTQEDPTISTELIYPVLIHNKICGNGTLDEQALKNAIEEYEKTHGAINESTIRKFLKHCQDRDLINPIGSQMLDDVINKLKNGFSSLSSLDHTRLPDGFIVFDNIVKFKMQMPISASPTSRYTFQYP
jgi:insulysin